MQKNARSTKVSTSKVSTSKVSTKDVNKAKMGNILSLAMADWKASRSNKESVVSHVEVNLPKCDEKSIASQKNLTLGEVLTKLDDDKMLVPSATVIAATTGQIAVVEEKPVKPLRRGTTLPSVGKFSRVAGSKVRYMYDRKGAYLGTITKLDDGGYQIARARDGKVRYKALLADAMRSIARTN